MTTIDAFNEWTAWKGVDPSDIATATGSSLKRDHVRTAYALYGFGGASTGVRTIPATSEAWIGWGIRPRTTTTQEVDGPFWEFLDSNGDMLFALSRDGGLFFETPTIYEEIPFSGSVDLIELCINFKIHPTEGFFVIFVDEIEVYSFSGDTQGSFLSEVVEMRLTRNATSDSTLRLFLFSEFLLSTQPTIKFEVHTLSFSEGAVNQWTGDLSEVVDVGYTDADGSLVTEDADTLITYTKSDLPTLKSEQFIASVHMEAAGQADTGAPGDSLGAMLYDPATSTEYEEEVFPLEATFSESFVLQFDEDPRTNAPWTETGVNDIQFGVASRSST